MRRFCVVSLVAAFVLVAVLSAFTGLASSEEKQRMYVGSEKCKMCHKTEAQGAQHVIWEKSSHAKAFATLASEEAKAVAAKAGVADPQKAAECLKCHVTAYGVDAKCLGEKFTTAEGVTCEACHGAGGDYISMKTMKAAASGEIEAASVGLVMPTKETCVGCHNEKSPTFKAFEFEKMVAKIAHPMPAERKAQYKKAESK